MRTTIIKKERKPIGKKFFSFLEQLIINNKGSSIMKKLFLYSYVILISLPLYVYACDDKFVDQEGGSYPFSKNLHVGASSSSDENTNTERQLVLSSPAKKVRPMPVSLRSHNQLNQEVFMPGSEHFQWGMLQQLSIGKINYLGANVVIPENFHCVVPYNDLYRKKVQDSRQEMCKLLAPMTRNEIKAIENKTDKSKADLERYAVLKKSEMEICKAGNGSILEEDTSVLFYSESGNLSVMITENINLFPIFFGELLTETPQIGKEQLIVNQFIKDLVKTLGTVSRPLLTTREYEYENYLNFRKLQQIALSSPLRYILNIYDDHTNLFENIADELLKCEEKYEQNKVISYEASRLVYDKDRREVYKKLIEKNVFTSILNREYKDDVKAHENIYDLILGWKDLTDSLLLACLSGTYDAQKQTYDTNERGTQFFNDFVFPILSSLFINQKGYFSDINTFYTNEFEAYLGDKLFLIIKFKAAGVNKVPALVFSGSQFSPRKMITPQQESKPQKAVATKQERNCVLM